MSEVYDREPYSAMRVWADMLADLQVARIGIGNRVGAAERDHTVSVEVFEDHIEELKAVEHKWELQLRRRYRKTVPPGVRAWQKDNRGIGEPLLARLIGHLGHPRIADPWYWDGEGADRHRVYEGSWLRSKAQLRAYCGHGDPSLAKYKGMTQADAKGLGNPTCKMLVHLLAEACVKQPGTPVSVLLGPDHGRYEPHVNIVGAEEPCTVNGDQNPIEAQRSSVAVDGTFTKQAVAVLDRPLSTVNGDQNASDHQVTYVAVDDTSPTSSDHRISDAQGMAVAAGGAPRYRLVYEQRRLVTVERTHLGRCIRCGPSGHPAEPGSPWTPKHQQADALRIVGKAILNDLWEAAEV